VWVVRREPLDGPMHIQLGDTPAQQHVIGRDVAERIAVS
jgi:Fe2+ transport system protein FeoA